MSTYISYGLVALIIFALYMFGVNLAKILQKKFGKKQSIASHYQDDGTWVPKVMRGFSSTMEKENLDTQQMISASLLLAGTVLSSIHAEEAEITCEKTGNTYKMICVKGDKNATTD